jgi:hypothetical protein
MQNKPQTETKHPDEWRADLNPAHLAGQNLGPPAAPPDATGHTAFDVKAVHRRLEGFRDDELKQIPVLPPGTRLQQGATYLDLADPERGAFTATGELEAVEGRFYVPKSETPYPLWNRLVGVENPERL